MLVAQAGLGQSTLTLASSLLTIASVTPGSAPTMADQTVTSVPDEAEYHVWPAAAGLIYGDAWERCPADPGGPIAWNGPGPPAVRRM